MKAGASRRALSGLAAGALLTAPLLGIFAVGWLAGIPFVPYTVFGWLIRVLPGRVVVFGLDLTISVLHGLGLDIKESAKTAEQVLAVASLFVAALVIALLFFVFARRASQRRIARCGLTLGFAIGAFLTAVAWTTHAADVPPGNAGKLGFTLWILVLWSVWGWGLARVDRFIGQGRDAPTLQHRASASARVLSRRRFLVEMGGLAATIVVAGAGVAAVLRSDARKADDAAATGIDLPNDDSPVEPAPGTRPEYTPVADHFRTDIALTVPKLEETTWRLIVDGAVEKPLSLTLDQLHSDFPQIEEFNTLSCIDNLIGGPLIATTLWTGVSLGDVIERARPLPDARYAHVYGDDGFDEEIALDLVGADRRVMLAHSWDGQPLPIKHGWPLRVLVPGRYGMKQPKWITRISLLADSMPGYWVARGYDETAEVRSTAVIDTVATKSLVTRGSTTYVPIGGIAYSGAKGISRVEMRVDDGAWQPVALRKPLSELTWVIWRYDWPFSAGKHYFAVRCYDGQGVLQETEERQAGPNGATGLFSEYREF